MDERTDGCMHACCLDGWSDGWMDGWIDEYHRSTLEELTVHLE